MSRYYFFFFPQSLTYKNDPIKIHMLRTGLSKSFNNSLADFSETAGKASDYFQLKMWLTLTILRFFFFRVCHNINTTLNYFKNRLHQTDSFNFQLIVLSRKFP